MFHPDNLSKVNLEGALISMSLSHFLQSIGGPMELMKGLRSNQNVYRI